MRGRQHLPTRPGHEHVDVLHIRQLQIALALRLHLLFRNLLFLRFDPLAALQNVELLVVSLPQHRGVRIVPFSFHFVALLVHIPHGVQAADLGILRLLIDQVVHLRLAHGTLLAGGLLLLELEGLEAHAHLQCEGLRIVAWLGDTRPSNSARHLEDQGPPGLFGRAAGRPGDPRDAGSSPSISGDATSRMSSSLHKGVGNTAGNNSCDAKS
mmetsp:Transcript_45320/g.145305  ORF Transcript_45320/g.145305 Transcript_45320/m.145305 type:complete len:211 (-) Transcript_45320:167-799(-)